MGRVQYCSIILLSSIVVMIQAEMTVMKEAYMSVPALVKAAGYPIEVHRVTTEDGYILKMHRIPGAAKSSGKGKQTKGTRTRAILIIHGMGGSSGDFVVPGMSSPRRSLAYTLADYGYDVWLGNMRGNEYTAHKTMSQKDIKFWDFSFHEQGKYDIPAMIDRTLNVTKVPKIMFLGYSMGNTAFLAMMSERPEYNDKLIAYIALAPGVYINDDYRAIARAFRSSKLTSSIVKRWVNVNSLSFPKHLIETLITAVCNVRRVEDNICMQIVSLAVGEDKEQIDWDLAATMFLKIQPVALRVLEHFEKIAVTGVFTEWAGGLDGPVKPYKLSNLKIPVTIRYGENDRLTSKKEILKLAEELKDMGVKVDIQPICSWPKFNHVDFVLAKDTDKMVNAPLVADINRIFHEYT